MLIYIKQTHVIGFDTVQQTEARKVLKSVGEDLKEKGKF